jgi:NitT/TauT family transport system substrate-binding protein
VKWKFVDLRLREALLLRGDVDAILGFDSTSYFNLLKGGAKAADVKFLYYSDSGMPLYSNCLIAAKKIVDGGSDIAKRFLTASGRSWQAAIADPKAAIAALQKQESLIDVALEIERLNWVIKNQLISDESRANGMGAVNAASRSPSPSSRTVSRFRSRPTRPLCSTRASCRRRRFGRFRFRRARGPAWTSV